MTDQEFESLVTGEPQQESFNISEKEAYELQNDVMHGGLAYGSAFNGMYEGADVEQFPAD